MKQLRKTPQSTRLFVCVRCFFLAAVLVMGELSGTAHPMIIDGQVIGAEDPNEIDPRRPTTCLAYLLKMQQQQRQSTQPWLQVRIKEIKWEATEFDKREEAHNQIEQKLSEESNKLLFTGSDRRIGAYNVSMGDGKADALVSTSSKYDPNPNFTTVTNRKYEYDTDPYTGKVSVTGGY